jgi:hypothetical protein
MEMRETHLFVYLIKMRENELNTPAGSMPPPSSFPIRERKRKQTAQVTGGINHATNIVTGSTNFQNNTISPEDSAALDAAVEIGFLLTFYSQHDTEILLQTLHRQGHLQLFPK